MKPAVAASLAEVSWPSASNTAVPCVEAGGPPCDEHGVYVTKDSAEVIEVGMG
jgi:hypothetical protein